MKKVWIKFNANVNATECEVVRESAAGMWVKVDNRNVLLKKKHYATKLMVESK